MERPRQAAVCAEDRFKGCALPQLQHVQWLAHISGQHLPHQLISCSLGHHGGCADFWEEAVRAAGKLLLQRTVSLDCRVQRRR